MKFLSGTSLGCIATMLATLTMHGAPAKADTVTLSAPVTVGPILYLVDPFLVAKLDNGGYQKNLDLTKLYEKHNMVAVHAAALSADNTSAAIAVVQTANNTKDLTLTTNNGTTLLPYDPKFLTKAPSGAGTTKLTIPAAQLVKVGARYYAAALVQAPAVGAAYNVAYKITVNARQNQSAPPVKIDLDIPPVILVHGLWGDKSSLQDLRHYLLTTPQWQRNKLVDAICYSPFLAFDAAKDPLTTGGEPCEVTSQTALDRQIEYLMAVLDKRHIVGGRVDVVAHSMGGLAIRHYSGLSEYRLPRNRNQGAFHQVVSLDTPELGSTLATYLVNHADATRQASTGSSPWNLWEAECGDGDTVRTCFSKLGIPLAADSQPLNTGSVFSLIPDGHSLNAAPGPRIPGTIWRAVTATWPQRDSPSSLLRSVLNTLIRAIYKDNQTAPSTSSILETQNNDVIVRTASQLGNAPVSYNFTDLAHTRTPDASAFSVFFDGVTQNVEQNESVNNLVGCWLANNGAASCKPAVLNAQPALDTANAQPQPAKFGAFNRLTLTAPTQVPQLGVPFELPLHFASTESRTISVSQSDGHGEIEAGSGKVAITRQAAGTSYISVTPQRIGPMTFTVAVAFADGGVAVKKIAVNVRPPAAAPTAFSADNSPVVIVLDSSEPVAMLHPEATYPGVGTIPLAPRLLTTSVQQSGAPVIQMKDGLIQALRAGEATVDVRYGGVVDHVQVIVKPTWE